MDLRLLWLEGKKPLECLNMNIIIEVLDSHSRQQIPVHLRAMTQIDLKLTYAQVTETGQSNRWIESLLTDTANPRSEDLITKERNEAAFYLTLSLV